MPRFELKTGEDRTAEESNNVQNIYGRGCLQRQAFPLPFFQSVALQPRRCLAKTQTDAGDAAAHRFLFFRYGVRVAQARQSAASGLGFPAVPWPPVVPAALQKNSAPTARSVQGACS